jgi:hypothetical protein
MIGKHMKSCILGRNALFAGASWRMGVTGVVGCASPELHHLDAIFEALPDGPVLHQCWMNRGKNFPL